MNRLRKNSVLHLILGGAVHRCGKRIVLNPALTAEGAPSVRELVFRSVNQLVPVLLDAMS
jgi:hypothetical protein